VLAEAIRKEFGDRAEICGANAGLHLLVWLKAKRGKKISEALHKAEAGGIGFYNVDSFYLRPPRRVGLVLGYAPMNERQIRDGVRKLAGAVGSG
jgi:GntR family transcriptional regulator / MocR family aminotransferase